MIDVHARILANASIEDALRTAEWTEHTGVRERRAVVDGVEYRDRRVKCPYCGNPFPNSYVLQHWLWAVLGLQGQPCIRCVEYKAGRRLVLQDFHPLDGTNGLNEVTFCLLDPAAR